MRVAPRSGSNSAVECQLPKLDVAGSIPVSRSNFFNGLERLRAVRPNLWHHFGIIKLQTTCFPAKLSFTLGQERANPLAVQSVGKTDAEDPRLIRLLR